MLLRMHNQGVGTGGELLQLDALKELQIIALGMKIRE